MKELVQVNKTAIVAVEHFSDTTIDKFIASRHCSPNTAKTYRNAIRQLLKFFALNQIAEPMTADVDNFINTLREGNKSDSTIRLYTTTTKLFFAYLSKNRIYHDVAADCAPLKLRKSSTHKKKALSDKQAKALLNAVKGNNLIALRDRAIIALCLQCGLRTVEISRANVGDLSDDGCDGFFMYVQGKGRIQKDAAVRVAPAVRQLIDSYLNLRGVTDSDAPLFASMSNNKSWSGYGCRLSEQSIGKLIKRMMISVGINDARITAHSTRHFAATAAIKSGCDLREVSQMLRHSSLVITSTYLHDLSLETRRAELKVADALFGVA